jgi:NADH-quinone oxidoreductase subunit C
MTVALDGKEVAAKLEQQFADSIIESSDESLLVKSESVFDIVEYLKSNPEFDFDYLNHITAVDYYEYFELIYQLTSLKHNHSVVVKTRCYGRDNPSVPSIISLYRGADYQEREIFDLMGIRFEGHPNLKRIALWDGFQGHPLRKDYLN